MDNRHDTMVVAWSRSTGRKIFRRSKPRTILVIYIGVFLEPYVGSTTESSAWKKQGATPGLS